MATGESTLTSSWWTADDWIDPQKVVISITGPGTVEYIWEVGLPSAAASGAPIDAGQYVLEAPAAGYYCYFRKTSASASLYYAIDNATPVNAAKVGYAYSDTGATTQGFVLSEIVSVGFDDLTAQSGTEPYTYAGYYPTIPAGLASGTSVSVAYFMLRLGTWTIGRTMRVYGLKYATDQSSGITSLTTLEAKTKTTAYRDVTFGVMSEVTLDITTIITELQGVSGWDGDSPIQFIVKDTGAAASGKNTVAEIATAPIGSRVVILLTSGGSPEPPTPGTGGP